MNLIFLDTFVINKFMDEDPFKLIQFINDNSYTLVVSSIHLVELYNKDPKNTVRYERLFDLLTEIESVLLNYIEIANAEENEYPYNLEIPPIKFTSSTLYDMPKSKKRAVYKNLVPSYISYPKTIGVMKWKK